MYSKNVYIKQFSNSNAISFEKKKSYGQILYSEIVIYFYSQIVEYATDFRDGFTNLFRNVHS